MWGASGRVTLEDVDFACEADLAFAAGDSRTPTRGNLVNDIDRASRTEEDRMDWRHRAACRDEDPELFFPIGNTGPALVQIEEAKAVCRRCDVIDECLSWALESGQDAGVWGGLSEDERRALKRRNARLRARTTA